MAALLARLPLSHRVDADDAALLDPHSLLSAHEPSDEYSDPQDALRPLTTLATRSKSGIGVQESMVMDSQRVFGLPLPSPIATPRQHTRYRSMSFDASTTESAPESSPPAASSTADDASVAEPDSPPSLSDEKGSDSSRSSLRSDSDLSDDTASTDKLARYDQLNLDDLDRDSLDDSNLKPESRPTLRRSAPRTRSIPNELQGDDRSYPRMHTLPRGSTRDHALNLPTGMTLKRGFTAPAQKSWGGFGSNPTSRSPSPTKPYVRRDPSVSPIMRSTSATSLSSEEQSHSSQTGFPQRVPWHPRRKSVKELEAECDGEEEEEVPIDAILENVPISPMPGMARGSRLSSRSTTPSPQRRGSGQAHANLHSANVPKNARRPSAPPVLPNGQRASPRTRHGRPPMPPHGATVGSYPLSRKHRSKSWTEDLNEEARQLSAALEEYAEKMPTEARGMGSGKNSAASSPPRPSLSKHRAMTDIRELSPSLKGSVMIDPLPISKEKEAVLSRTRPSWLPPKCQKEERKHLREWEQMMARAAEAERKRALKEREERESREEMTGSIARVWDQHVLPNWKETIKQPSTRELWWRGVTPRCRGEVWRRAIGNELELSETSYSAALNRANTLEEKLASLSDHERNASREAAWFDAIRRDVPTVFHEQSVTALDMDRSRPPFHTALADVLRAYAMYRHDVGYVYGTHDIAGLLCLHMSPSDAFVTLANALNRPIPLAFLMHDAPGMSRVYTLVLSTLKYKLPRLHDHFTSPNLDLQPAEYLDPLFRRLLTGPPLSPDLSARVWDVFAFEGDNALVRAAVAVLARLEPRLYVQRDEILELLGWAASAGSIVALGTEDEFIAAVREAGKAENARTPEA